MLQERDGTMGGMLSDQQLERLDGAVLYDMFYEAGTMLGGRLIFLLDRTGDQKWFDERLQLERDRRSVPANDRTAQIALKRCWDARWKELGEYESQNGLR